MSWFIRDTLKVVSEKMNINVASELVLISIRTTECLLNQVVQIKLEEEDEIDWAIIESKERLAIKGKGPFEDYTKESKTCQMRDYCYK